MKLWLLRPREEFVSWCSISGPWEHKWDMSYGFVVRAETEAEARAMVNRADEDNLMNEWFGDEGRVWEDPEYTTCVELTADGPAEVVIKDFLSA